MDDSVRPVRLRKVVLGYHYAENKQSEFQFDLTLSYKLAGVIKTYSEDKPTLVVLIVLYEPCHEKICFLHMRTQRGSSAAGNCAADQRLC